MLASKLINKDLRLAPYIESLQSKEFTYTRGTLVDDETYLSIVYKWLDWYEARIARVIDNTVLLFDKMRPDTYIDNFEDELKAKINRKLTKNN